MMISDTVKARLELSLGNGFKECSLLNSKKHRNAMKSYLNFFLLFCISCPSYLDARIGEDRLTIERRLLKSGGYQYREDNTIENRKRGMPYLKFEDYLPEKADLRIYYKTIDGRKPLSKDIKTSSMLEGWNLHILFIQGKSVLEIYKRSEKITEFELIHLLNLQSGNSFWEKKSHTDLDTGKFSAFGFELERNDKSLRAKKLGANGLMIFSALIDHQLKKNIREEQMGSAPESIEGF
jgi:hypothetical protein